MWGLSNIQGLYAYVERAVQVWQDLTEIANDNCSAISTSGRETAIILGDGNWPYVFAVLNDRANLRQRRCVQERDGSAREGGDEFAIGGQRERVDVTRNFRFSQLGPSGHIEGPDFVVVRCWKDSPTIAWPRKRSDSSKVRCGGVNVDEYLAIATVENAERAIKIGYGDMLAIGGESDSSDSILMLE